MEKEEQKKATLKGSTVPSISRHFFNSLPIFPSVEGEDIELKPFLEAASGLKSFVSILGPTLFSPVIKDMQGNIDRLSKCASSHESVTSLVKAGIDENDAVYKYEPVLALLWLTRAIQFIAAFLTLLLQDYNSGTKKDNLKQYFQMAYEMSLQKYHSWFTRKIVSCILASAPSREQLMDALIAGNSKSADLVDGDDCESELFKSIEMHLSQINLNISAVHSIFNSVGYDWKN